MDLNPKIFIKKCREQIDITFPDMFGILRIVAIRRNFYLNSSRLAKDGWLGY